MNFTTAREHLKNVLLPTPLMYSPIFSEESGNNIYIKPENLQKTGAFKIRGAYNKMLKLTEAEKQRGVIASSAGNHAQGVAYAARELGIKAVIVMPKTTPLIKVQSTKKYGAEVVLYGDVYDDAYQKAKELEEKEGYVFVHPFNDPDVLEGQGTIALEILEQLPQTDVIVVPIGGGGLISGIACAAKQIKPEIKIVGVEPSGAASATEALKKNKLVTLPEANTIADGTAIGMGLTNAVSRLANSKAPSKVVILLTDGANNAGDISPLTAAEIAKQKGIRVYTIAVGRQGMVPQPVGILPDGSYYYSNVKSDMDPATIRSIAKATGGLYYAAASERELRRIYKDIDKLERTKLKQHHYNKYYEAFTPFAWAAFALLLSEIVLRLTWLRRIP